MCSGTLNAELTFQSLGRVVYADWAVFSWPPTPRCLQTLQSPGVQDGEQTFSLGQERPLLPLCLTSAQTYTKWLRDWSFLRRGGGGGGRWGAVFPNLLFI